MTITISVDKFLERWYYFLNFITIYHIPLFPKQIVTFLCGGLVTKSCLTLATPKTVACQAPLFMGFIRQEYWSALPFPSPGDLLNPGIESRSPALQAVSLPTEPREDSVTISDIRIRSKS